MLQFTEIYSIKKEKIYKTLFVSWLKSENKSENERLNRS